MEGKSNILSVAKQCRLCLQPKTLIKKSHIISEFLYKPLYDSKKKLISVQTNKDFTNLEITKPSKGFYEPDLLCPDCEQHLSKYETYVSKMLSGKDIHQRHKLVVTQFDNGGDERGKKSKILIFQKQSFFCFHCFGDRI